MTGIDENTLAAYVDGELDRADASAVEDALRHDAAAREKATRLRESTALLRAALSLPMHETIPSRLQRTLGPRPPSRRLRAARVERRRLLAVAAVALLAAGLLVSGGYLAGRSGGGPGTGSDRLVAGTGAVAPRPHEEDAGEVIEEILAYHAFYTGKDEYLVEAGPGQLDRLQDWSADYLHRRVPIPSLRAFGLEFSGGRLLVAGDQAVSQLIYNAPGADPVAICVTLADASTRPSGIARAHGLTALWWQRGGYLYAIVGTQSVAALRSIAHTVSPELESI